MAGSPGPFHLSPLPARVIAVRVVIAVPVIGTAARVVGIVMAVPAAIIVVGVVLVMRRCQSAHRGTNRCTAEHRTDFAVAKQAASDGANASAKQGVTPLNACVGRGNRKG